MLNQLAIPPAVDHPLWQDWWSRAHIADVVPYGAHDHLHHYVRSYSALMSILASQTLWASDVQHLKDTTEFEHGIPICYEALDLIREPILLEHVHLVKEGLAARFRHRTFISCFSTRGDLASQWDEYADAQRGFVIGFDSLVLSALSSPQGYRLMPVEYGRDAQLERARRAVRRALSDLREAFPGLSELERVWSIQARFVLLSAEMFFFCASFKAPKYRAENEWRLIYTRQDNEDTALPIQTRIAADRVIDYVTVDLRNRYGRRELPSFAFVRAGARTDANCSTLAWQWLRENAKQTSWQVQTPL
jgi:hypothetical protein